MKERIPEAVLAIIFAAVGFNSNAANEPRRLLAGTAKVDITYPAGGMKDAAAKKIQDRLFARVLVLQDQDTSLAIVAADMIFFASPEVVRAAKEKWGLDHVILSGTHTHSGGYPAGGCTKVHPEGTKNARWTRMGDPSEVLNMEFPEDAWYQEVEEKVVAAIGEAKRNLFPARIGAGKAPLKSAYLAHNRRLVKADGKVEMLWTNPERIPTRPVDPTVGVIRIDDDTGAPRSLLVHYACHATTLMGSGVISADYPGAMCDYVEKEMGDQCMAMFLQGASGDIDPYLMKLPATEHRLNVVRQTGASLGRKAVQIARGVSTRPHAGGTLKVKESLLAIDHRKVGSYTPAPDKTSPVGLTTVTYGKEFAWLAIPGEPFAQHQIDLTRQSPVPNSFILGLAYSGQGTPFAIYIPTQEAIRQGGYGADEATFLAAGAGERMVSEGLACINSMLRTAEGAKPGD